MSYFEQFNQQHPVRKTRAQKRAFRSAAMAEMTALSYAPVVEESDKGRHHNVIAGDPDHAKLIVTAHYDTPAHWLPDVQIPRNFPVYAAWQVLLILGMLILSGIVGAGLGLLTNSGDVMILMFFGAFVALMLLQLYGPANPSNANDNTSGVAALLETMARIPEEKRDQVAFILFDNCESGRRGSKAFARDHVEIQHTKCVLSLDSVGVGEHFLVIGTALARNTMEFDALERGFVGDNDHQVHFVNAATTRCGADFRSFKCGVGVMACERSGGVGFVLGDLHTPRDTRCDQGNIAFLTDCLARVIEVL